MWAASTSTQRTATGPCLVSSAVVQGPVRVTDRGREAGPGAQFTGVQESRPPSQALRDVQLGLSGGEVDGVIMSEPTSSHN